MPSLFASFSLARQSLAAHQYALDIAQKNIANVNTPGYTRERVNMIPGTTPDSRGYLAGSGNLLTSLDSFRDRFIDFRINDELQDRAGFDALSAALKQVEAVVNENAGQGIQTALSEFFKSFSALANTPDNLALRQGVLDSARNLVTEMQRVYAAIQQIQTFQDRAIGSTVAEINNLTESLAKLNSEIVSARSFRPEDAESLMDQRQQLLDRLAELVDISYHENESGQVIVATRQGAPLVTGTFSHALTTVHGGIGSFLRVQSNGSDITSKIEAGKLGGLIAARDSKIPGYLSSLDDLAAALIQRVNTVHGQGSDLNGNQGGDFFVPFVPPVSGSNTGAVRSMSVSLSDPVRIAAAALGGGTGNNANARLLADIENESLFSGGTETAVVFYSRLIYRVGSDSRSTVDHLRTQQNLVTQLQNHRDSKSGVSLDDEAVNIIRFQKAYEANARFIRVLDALADDLMRLLGG